MYQLRMTRAATSIAPRSGATRISSSKIMLARCGSVVQGSAEEEEDKAIVLVRFMVRPSMLVRPASLPFPSFPSGWP